MFISLIPGIYGSLAAPPLDENLPPRPREGATKTKFCEFKARPQDCDLNNDTLCIPVVHKEECLPAENDKSNHCFVLWLYDNVTNTAISKVKGCFLDTVACNDRPTSCRPHNIKLPLLHCCCEGDMCNENATFPGVDWSFLSTEPPPEKVPASPVPTSEAEATTEIIIYTLTPLTILFIVLFASYFLYRRRKETSFAELANGEVSLSRPPSAGAGMENEGAGLVSQLNLCEVRARGRFGAVWRAKLGQRDVAVKVFPLQDKQSWVAEQEIFRLPRMDHPDILHYIGVDKKGDNLQAEYWLITAYHEKVRILLHP